MVLPKNVIEVQEKIFGNNDKKDKDKDEDNLEYTTYQFFNCTDTIETFVNSVFVLRKGKKLL